MCTGDRGENGFIEEYTCQIQGRPNRAVVTVKRNTVGNAQHLVLKPGAGPSDLRLAISVAFRQQVSAEIQFAMEPDGKRAMTSRHRSKTTGEPGDLGRDRESALHCVPESVHPDAGGRHGARPGLSVRSMVPIRLRIEHPCYLEDAQKDLPERASEVLEQIKELQRMRDMGISDPHEGPGRCSSRGSGRR